MKKEEKEKTLNEEKINLKYEVEVIITLMGDDYPSIQKIANKYFLIEFAQDANPDNHVTIIRNKKDKIV